MQAHAVYSERLAARDAVLNQLEARAAWVSRARLAVALAALALVAAIVWSPLPWAAWYGVAALVIAFLGLVVRHAAIFEKKDRALAALRFYERGLARLADTWHDLPRDGARFRTADHPYADDLDIFGRSSLFQLLDTTETRLGEEHLAAILSGQRRADDLAGRQAAVRDLVARLDFRERLSTAGAVLLDRAPMALRGADRPNPTPFLLWAESSGPPASVVLRLAAWGLPALTLGVFFAARALGLPWSLALLPYAVELTVLRSIGERVTRVTAAASAQERGFQRYADALRAIEEEPLAAPHLRELKARLSASGAAATAEMNALGRVVGFLDARNNEVFRFFIGPLFMWDLHCVLALERWRARAGKLARGWLDALGEMEALGSLAAFAYEHPTYAWPDLEGSPRFEATALGHPLIAATRRVANDVTLSGPGTALVITGSNMSGKSTLLRAMGINAALARAGAPVCAEKLALGPLAIVTSMRVSDSLEAGVSHFYAEVARLKRVLDLARERHDVLFLLDEILHGTNSRERLIGARAVVRELLRVGALGGVSTHDLGIGDLEDELPGAVVNVHFEEQVVGDKMTFDYRLRRGVVQSSNALRLMRMVGIDVVPLDP